MKCFTENCNKFVRVVECIEELFEHVQLDFEEEGLFMRGTNFNRTVFMNLQLKPPFFTEYKGNKKSVTIVLKEIIKILKCANNQDQMEIKLINDDSNLEFIFTNQAENKKGRFQISLKQFQEEHQKIQKFETENFLMLKSEMFSSVIKNLGHLADNLKIQTHSKRIRFVVKGNASSGFVEFSELGDIKMKIVKHFQEFFAFQILMSFCKLDKIEDQIYLFFQSNKNLVLHMDLEGDSNLSFHVAPKFIKDN